MAASAFQIIRTDEVSGHDAGGATGGISSLLDSGRSLELLRPAFSTVVKIKTRRNVGAIYRAAWEAGYTAKEAAQAVGVTVASAYSYGARHGLVWAKDNSHRYEARRAEYLACWKSGMTAAEAAAKIGVGRCAAYSWANSNGLRWAAPQKNRYRECLDAGLTVEQTATRLGVRSDALKAWARRNGVRFKGQPMSKRNFSAALGKLSAAERRDFDFLRSHHRYGAAEALRAIKRADLVPGDGV